MSTDDRDDVESENPAKSFKVGEVDRLSGFFTPVWESKRRLRADPPVPPSSAAASAPSSSRSAASDKTPPPPVAVTRPSVPPPAPENAPALKGAPARTSSPPPPPRVSKPAPAQPPRATKPRGSRGVAEKRVAATAPEKSAAELAPTPLVPPAARAAPAESSAPGPAETLGAIAAMKVGGATLRGVATPLPPPAPAAATNGEATTPAASPAAAAPEPASPEAPAAGEDRGAATFGAAAAVTVRPVIPMPLTPPVRPPSRSKATPVPAPSAAALALKNAGPNLPTEAFLDREPEFRPSSPPGTSPPPARAEVDPRAARAAKVATSLHEQLKGKFVTDSVDTFARHRETESEREALQAAAERAAKQPADPYPSHVLRTLRRTIHLSSPLPEAVRQMLEKYRY